tara:strand:- start:19207 stop:19554 length:348 start_codon:yes stop_codon:yes gene_type:complete
MMLENSIKKLTEAVVENNKQLESLRLTISKGGAPAPTTPETPDPSPAQADEPAAPPPSDVTYDDLVAKFTELGKKSRDAAIGLLGEYGASKLPDIKKQPEKFAEIAAKIDAKLAS